MKSSLIRLLIITIFLSGCAHTTMSTPYYNGSYHNNSSTIENIIGFGILAVATTGIVLAAVNSDSDEYDYKHSYSDKHSNHHQRPNKTNPSKRPHKV